MSFVFWENDELSRVGGDAEGEMAWGSSDMPGPGDILVRPGDFGEEEYVGLGVGGGGAVCVCEAGDFGFAKGKSWVGCVRICARDWSIWKIFDWFGVCISPVDICTT